jgi:hypothetical protein
MKKLPIGEKGTQQKKPRALEGALTLAQSQHQQCKVGHDQQRDELHVADYGAKGDCPAFNP